MCAASAADLLVSLGISVLETKPMSRLLALTLLVAATALAQGRSAVQFRVKKEPDVPRHGWMLSYDDTGFRFERFGGGSKVFIRWDELIEEDSRFGTLFAEFQEPLAYRRPTLELVGQVMGDTGDPVGANAWELCRGLFTAGLVETVDARTPRAEWVLRVPPLTRAGGALRSGGT